MPFHQYQHNSLLRLSLLLACQLMCNCFDDPHYHHHGYHDQHFKHDYYQDQLKDVGGYHHEYLHHKKPVMMPRDVMVDVVNDLALKLLAVHNKENQNNIALSPYGALCVLAALSEGLEGQAAWEIHHAAQIPKDRALVRVGLRDIHRHLKSYFIPKEGFLAGLTLNHENVTLNSKYEEILKFYGYDYATFNNALYPEPMTTSKPIVTTLRVGTEPTLTSTKVTTTPRAIVVSTSGSTAKLTTPVFVSSTTTASKVGVSSEVVTSSSDTTTVSSSIVTSAPTTTLKLTTNDLSTTPLVEVTTLFNSMSSETQTPSTGTEQMTEEQTTSTEKSTVTKESTIIPEVPTSTPSTSVEVTTTEAETSTSQTSTATTLEVLDVVPNTPEALTTVAITDVINNVATEVLTEAPAVAVTDVINNVATKVLTTEAPAVAVTDAINNEAAEALTTEAINFDTPDTPVDTLPSNDFNVQDFATTVNPEVNVQNNNENFDYPFYQDNPELVDPNVTPNYDDITQNFLDPNATTDQGNNAANIGQDNARSFRRNVRSLVDYIIAKYYDELYHKDKEYPLASNDGAEILGTDESTIEDYNIGDANGHYVEHRSGDLKHQDGHEFDEAHTIIDKPPLHHHHHHHTHEELHEYVPDPALTFLVYGKYRESKINFMKYDSMLPFLYVPYLEALALSFPLDSTKYYLLLLLPTHEQGIDRLICDLRLHGDLRYIVENLKVQRVVATIPSFTLKGYVVLTPTLQKLGIKKVFEPRQSDFTPMTNQSEVYVTNIEQAVTVRIRNYVDPVTDYQHKNLFEYEPVHFKADHPFLYFVIDAELNIILMIGKVVNPLNSRIR